MARKKAAGLSEKEIADLPDDKVIDALEQQQSIGKEAYGIWMRRINALQGDTYFKAAAILDRLTATRDVKSTNRSF